VTLRLAGSLTTDPPGGIVTEEAPRNVSAVLVPGTMEAPEPATPACAFRIFRGLVPLAFDNRMRVLSPPKLARRITRIVSSSKLSLLRLLTGKAHDATQEGLELRPVSWPESSARPVRAV
jgi:hypothetical protein